LLDAYSSTINLIIQNHEWQVEKEPEPVMFVPEQHSSLDGPHGIKVNTIF
jgi:hypothetical protein